MMKRVFLLGCLAASLLLSVATLAEPEVREHAVEEIMPGIFVRDTSGVTIDLGDRRCNPPCPEGESCDSICAPTACDPNDGPLARCSACSWECR